MFQADSKLLNIFETIGVTEVIGGVLSDREYRNLYSLYDALFYDQSNKHISISIQDAALYWNSVKKNSSAYTSAPIGFNDRRVRNDKEQKTYFQYCLDFGDYIKSLNIYKDSQVLRKFIYELNRIVDITKEQIKVSLETLEKELPKKIKNIIPDFNDIKILIKVLSYHPSEDWATGVHYDKSALTLVHHGSDMKNEPFRITSYNKSKYPDISEMLIPQRYIDNENNPGTGLLFPGLLFGISGVEEIKPSPHVVAKQFSEGQRYATIGFLMIPELDASSISTKLQEV